MHVIKKTKPKNLPYTILAAILTIKSLVISMYERTEVMADQSST